ncbi:aspartate aminotransferase family protein [Parasalinivibrio latis]|uniref:class-III pyridoxal-phosphate-dependent aminotransferase n=1 Tax=Parasalinivibrio latis TaxID=2952610 RepID=UPI0030E442D5
MDNILKCHEVLNNTFVKADNCYLYDDEGNRFVDLESGIWCTSIGHCHPRVNRVFETQANKLVHLGTRFLNAFAHQAAERILNQNGMPGGKCVFLSSGSEAVELGVKIAQAYTQRPLCISSSNAHLASYGSAGTQRSDEWIQIDWNNPPPLQALPYEKIGALVFEPGGSGVSFVHFPPTTYVENLAENVKQHGGIIVVNEVTTGMGRTGKWFGYQHYDLQPDVVALGKGLGAGYPVSAVAMKREVADKLESQAFTYVQSHQNDPLGCAVANEVLSVIKDEKLIERSATLGAVFLDGLRKIEKRFDIVKNTRGRGLLLAIEFHPDARLSVTNLHRTLLEKGYLVGYYPKGNILRFSPPLTINEPEIEKFLLCLESLLA